MSSTYTENVNFIHFKLVDNSLKKHLILDNGCLNAKNHVNGHVNKFEDKHSTISLLKCSKLPYQEIKKKLRDNGLLFEDNDFSPGSKALFNHKKPSLQPIIWLRPHVSIFLPLLLSL